MSEQELDPDYIPDYITLYGFTKSEVSSLKSMPYEQAIQTKIDAAMATMDELYKPHFTERDAQRIARVHKAIKFNIMLLEELV